MVQHLTTTQGNALVFTTLVGFMFVGLFAGWRVSRKDYISGVRTQRIIPLTLNWIASTMSSSLLFGYPQLAVIPGAGILGLAAYSFATILPLWFFLWLGPQIRKLAPNGFVLSAFFHKRYGPFLGCLSALGFVGFIFAFMLVELNTYGSVVKLLGNVNPTVSAVVVAVTTTIYTAYGGFRASLWTDNVNAVVIVVLMIMTGAAIGTKLDISRERIVESGLAQPHWLGATLWWVLPAALVFSQMINQGFWQRAFAARDDRTLFWSVLLATPVLFSICFLVGMTGPLSQWAGLFNGPTDVDNGQTTFFYILATLPAWVQGCVLVLCGALSSSAYDTFQSAQISTIYGDLFMGKVNIWWCRVLLALINVPSVVMAVKNVDILKVFSVADLGAACALPAPLLGLIPALWFLNGFDVFFGACGAFFTVFLFGLVFYHGDVHKAGNLLGLPDGLYVQDYSVFGAFFAAPIGSVLWTFVAFLFRAAVMWVVCRYMGWEYDVLDKEKRAIRPEEWTNDDGRPIPDGGDVEDQVEIVPAGADTKSGGTESIPSPDDKVFVPDRDNKSDTAKDDIDSAPGNSPSTVMSSSTVRARLMDPLRSLSWTRN